MSSLLKLEATRQRRHEPEALSLGPPGLITVDRSIPPTYPEWMKTPVDPELSRSGPPSFNLAKVEAYLHPWQIGGGIIFGPEFHLHLKDTGIINRCLSLRDGEEIVKAVAEKRVKWPEKFCDENLRLYLWKDAAWDLNPHIRVPILSYFDGRVSIGWNWYTMILLKVHPAAVFEEG